MSRLNELTAAGVSIWLDTLSRDLLESGAFRELVDDFAVSGATSNPTIFAKAIGGSGSYDEQLRGLTSAGTTDPQELFFALALQDVREAAYVLEPIHRRTEGRDGFVSFECTPDLADDAEATVAQALELWQRLHLPNVLIKVPATAAGVIAIEELTAAGVNVNVTLLFSLQRYEEVIEAYLRGLERRLAAGRPVDGIRSVASFFVSRVDAKADAALPASSPLRGQVAIANAQLAYGRYESRFAGARWDALAAAGAQAQRPLWASTGTKDPSYSDVLYVEGLVAPNVINTMPEATLRAFADHGAVGAEGGPDLERAEEVLREAAAEGVDLNAVTQELEREGVEAFCASYRQLLEVIETRSEDRARGDQEREERDRDAEVADQDRGVARGEVAVPDDLDDVVAAGEGQEGATGDRGSDPRGRAVH
jgi:transaldolase